MNHGLKVNGNTLEITLPEEVRIDKVIVNRQIFSQRMQVCKSCKYHEKEGHEEPCVSCEVGNSNYVAVEERKKGKWIWQTENRYVCSECGYHTQVDELFEEPMYAFCPYCSTSMLDEDGNVRYER